MIYTELTKKAMKLCFEAHKEQKDKSGLPFEFSFEDACYYNKQNFIIRELKGKRKGK